ncbi:MAG: hypothetical protein JF591_20325 [Lysobacter sp.]|nr:hypothetical protein [Lysobacter sp.]
MREHAKKPVMKPRCAARNRRDGRRRSERFHARYRNQNERLITHRNDGMLGPHQSLTTETFARQHQPRDMCLQLMNFAHVSGKKS